MMGVSQPVRTGTGGRWNLIAVVLVGGFGLLLAIPGYLGTVLFGMVVASGSVICGMGCGWEVLFLGLAVICAVIGTVHLVAAAGIRNRRRWGRALALISIVPVLLVALLGLISELSSRQSPFSAFIAIPWLAACIAVVRAE